MVICYEELIILCYKELIIPVFLWRSYQNNEAMYHWIVYLSSFYSKTFNENECDNVNVKFSRESEYIIAAACICPAGSRVKYLGKCNHVGAILFALEYFNKTNLKTFVKPLTCTS